MLGDAGSRKGAEKAAERHALSNGVVKKLVASQVPFQSSNVEAVGVAQAFQSSELDVQANLIAWIFSMGAVDAFLGGSTC